MAETIEHPSNAEMLALYGKAMAVQSRMLTPAPDPAEFMKLLWPMKFRKKVNKPFRIQDMKSFGTGNEEGVFQVTSLRHQLMLGVRGLKVKFPAGTIFHK